LGSYEADVDSPCACQFPKWLARDPEICPTFAISDLEDLSSDDFINIAIGLCRVYEIHMEEGRSGAATISPETVRAADMTFHVTDPESGFGPLRFEAFLDLWPNASGLHLRVLQWGVDDDGIEARHSVDLLNQVYIPELRRRIPAAEAAGYHPQQAAANIPDGLRDDVVQVERQDSSA
jgi:hypothetical protein